MLGLSYKNVRELNTLIDTQIPNRPRFIRQDIEIAEETVTMYSRNVIDCIKALYGNTMFAEHMVFRPERHYDHNNVHQRQYHDLHTGEWWWQTQVCRPSICCLCQKVNKPHYRLLLRNRSQALRLCPSYSHQTVRK